jgi:hypothetical protein
MPSENFSFSSEESPEAKGWISKKLVPAIQNVGNTAGKISSITGKVATVAALL